MSLGGFGGSGLEMVPEIVKKAWLLLLEVITHKGRGNRSKGRERKLFVIFLLLSLLLII